MNVETYIASGAIEACILGLASPEENKLYQEMRLQYPAVKEFADLFEVKLEEASLQNAKLEPSPYVFDQIKQQIQNSGTGTEAPVRSIHSTNPGKKSIWQQYGVAASIALLLGSVLFNFILAGKIKDLQIKVNDAAKIEKKTDPSQAQFAFFKESNITPIALYGVGIHNICNCSLYWDKSKNTAYFLIHHLFPPGQEKDYQVWAQVDGKPVSLGILKYNAEKIPIAIPNIPPNATKFTVTLEKKGGNEQPTLEEIYLMGQISA